MWIQGLMRGRSRCGAALLLLVSAAAGAQTVNYDVLVDADRNTATGCTVTPSGQSPLGGFEHRIRAVVDNTSQTVTEVNLSDCDGSVFTPPVATGGPHPVGLNNGEAGADVVELSAALSSLALPNGGLIGLAVVADDGDGADVMASVDGSPGGGPILFGLPVNVPALGLAGLLLLASVLLVAGAIAGRRNGKWLALGMVAVVAVAVAAHFLVDGEVTDWNGLAPNATDPAGDASNGGVANDVRAFFMAHENGHLFFRVDAADLENVVPDAQNDSYTTDEDTALNVAAPGVLDNDSDADMDPVTAVLSSGPANAQSFALNADGSFDYTPGPDFNGTDSFTYVANDGIGDSAPATVTITVNPVNDAPAAADDAYTTDEDTQLDVTAPGVLGNDDDVDTDPLTAVLVSGPANAASFTLNADGSFSYTPSADFNGSDSFTYEADDGALASNIATVTITVNPVNDPPVAVADGYTTDEDVTLNSAPAGVLDNDTDTETDPLTAVLVGGPSSAQSFTLNPDGTFMYTPSLHFNGTDSFTYMADDGSDDSNVATVTLTVNPLPDPPVAMDDTATTDEDSPATIDVTANDTDPDGDMLNVIALGGTPVGSPVINGNNVDYDPNGQFESLAAGETDTDSFTYTVEDATMNQVVATVMVTITGVNDDPVATLPSAQATYIEGAAPVDLDPGATVTDVDSADFDGGTLTLEITTNSAIDDRLVINSDVPPNPPGFGIELSGADIFYNGNAIGTFSGGTDGSTPLVIDFATADATPAAVQALARKLAFEDTAVPVTETVRTVSLALTDGDGGTSAIVTQTVEAVPPVLCDGTVHANFCWWLGDNGESCDTVCADHGGNDATGTTDYAGSGGNDANCGDVMTALNLDTGNPPDPTPVTNQAGTLGCASDFTGSAFTIRFTDPTDAAATGTNIRRACACNDQPAPVSIDYAGAPFNLPRGVAISPITPTVNGYVASYSITPALPAGLNFDTATGGITGTPTASTASTGYTVTATNAGGFVDTTFMLEVVPQPPQSLAYPGAPFLFNLNNMVSPQFPTVTGQVDSYAISPALPAGLMFDTATGEIAGTPTALQAATNHTVTATNIDGMDSVVVSVEVTDMVACDGVTLAGFCWYLGNNGESCDTVCSGRGGNNAAGTTGYAGSGGNNTQCGDVMTALNTATGNPFNPTPVTNSAGTLGCASDYSGTAFTIRYTDATSASVTGTNIRRACACNDQPPPTGLSYPGAPFTFIQGIMITPQSPSVTNAVVNWSISPALPAGLNFDTSSGVISGTPTALQAATNHTVTATNAGGMDSVVISVEVQAQPPMNLDYPGSPFVFSVGVPISPAQLPTVTGGVDSYSISLALPAGITFDTGTGAIGGTPTATSPATNYTVTATNTAGSDMTTISVEVSGALSCDPGGVVVGGNCWYLGTNSQSCDDVCSSHGGYDAATATYAGSGGTNSNCGNVMTALEAANGHPFNPTPVSDQAGTLGCASDYTGVAFTIRHTDATSSSATGTFIRRACACNN